MNDLLMNMPISLAFPPRTEEARLVNRLLNADVISDSVASFWDLEHATVQAAEGLRANTWESAREAREVLEDRLPELLDYRKLDASLPEGFDEVTLVELGCAATDNKFVNSFLPDRLSDGAPLMVGHVRNESICQLQHRKNIQQPRLDSFVRLKSRVLEHCHAYTGVAKLRAMAETGELPKVFVGPKFLLATERRVKEDLYGCQNVELAVVDLLKKDMMALWGNGGAPDRKRYSAWAQLRFHVINAILQCGFDAFVLGQCDGFYHEPDYLELSDIDQELFGRLCDFLPARTGREQAIPCLRWGVQGPVAILQEIADSIDTTRERVRQLQVEAENEFSMSLRIPSSVIAKRITGIPLERLVLDLPSLRSAFTADTDFRRFVETVIGEPNGIPVTDYRILEPFFATHGQPIHRDQIEQHLVDDHGQTALEAEYTVQILQAKPVIRVDVSGRVEPVGLPRPKAVAHVLSSVPYALSQKAVYQIVNDREYSSKPGKLERPNSNDFSQNPLVYLAGKCGVETLYKHVSGLRHLTAGAIEEVLSHAHTHLRSTGNRSTVTGLCAALGKIHNYFEIRYMLRTYGEQFGILWDGASQSDNFYLPDTDSPRITFEDLVYRQILNSGGEGISTTELQLRLPGTTKGMISAQLFKLKQSGKLFYLERNRFVAFESIQKTIPATKVTKILHICKELLEDASGNNQMVEADCFRSAVNAKLDDDAVTKPYISSFLSLLGPENGVVLHHCRTLFSLDEIPYTSLVDLMTQLCDPQWNIDQCRTAVNTVLIITNSEFSRAYSAWRRQEGSV